MSEELHLTRSDLAVLFWIVGSQSGATTEEILEHEQNRHRTPPTSDAVREILARLEDRSLIYLAGDRYRGNEQLRKEFFAACRNCRDTIEEIDILRRIIPTLERT